MALVSHSARDTVSGEPQLATVFCQNCQKGRLEGLAQVTSAQPMLIAEELWKLRPGCRVILAEEPADRAQSLEPESSGARRPPKRRYQQQRIVNFGLRVQPVTPPAYPSGWSVS